MRAACPRCLKNKSLSEDRIAIVKAGYFRRKSDSKKIQRYRCKTCHMHFSSASLNPCFRQHKRHFNHRVGVFLCSEGSQRRAAKIFRLSRTTVARKLVFLGKQAILKLEKSNSWQPKVNTFEFDDLETFEHTKCKPLSVTLAVEYKTRRILDFEVSQMSAKGRLTHKALKKYGYRQDKRTLGRRRLFKRLKPLIHDRALIKSDENPYYINDVKHFFPLSVHEQYKGQRGAITGQGELKKVGFDPLFSLNHTCAMMRANINRLIRKTWCTTKKAEKLKYHIAIYVIYHNFHLINTS